MGNREWFDTDKFRLIVVCLLLVAIIVTLILVIRQPPNIEPVSPVSPLAVEARAVKVEQFDNMDGKGTIEWYDDFYVWNPRAQAVSYPFLTGTVAINWDDPEVAVEPVAVPYPVADTRLVIELVLSGTQIYTQVLDTEIMGVQGQPGTGNFYNPLWEWINIAPGTYDEYIKGYWLAGDEIIPVSLVADGQVVQPVTGFVLYRENLVVPELTYLPVIMKRQ